MSSLSWAATCPVKNWKIKHRGRRLCCTVSVVSSRTYHSTLTHHAPATQTSFVLFKEARLSPVSGLGSCSFTCLAHTSSDLPTAGSPSLFRTQFKCHLLRALILIPLSSFQPHWPPSCSSGLSRPWPPQDLCTGHSLCLKLVSSIVCTI